MKQIVKVTNISPGQKRFRDKYSGEWIVLMPGDSTFTASPPHSLEFKVEKVTQTEEPKVKKKSDLDKLSKIKGIGTETVNDLKKIYSSMDDLRKALLKDSVPLRNDLVELLKNNLLEVE